MQAKPTASAQWLLQPFLRGAGVFVGRITPSGERLFYFRYTDSKGGRPFLPLGPYHPKGRDGLTLARAYERAAELSALYRSGIKDLREHLAKAEEDHLAADQTARRALEDLEREAELAAQRRLTVRQLFDRWRSTQLQPRPRADGKRTGRKDGGEYVSAQFERHVFPKVGHMTAGDLRKADLLELLDAQTSLGKMRTANVLLANLKQMFDFALERELIATNPLANVKKRQVGGASVERERALAEAEIKMLPSAVSSASMNPRSAVALWVILATGVRIGELMGAVWAEAVPTDPIAAKTRLSELQTIADAEGVKLGIVDSPARTWYMPTTKNQREHTIHLSEFAIAQFEKLRAMREVASDSKEMTLTPWVFPATDNQRPVCVKSFGKQLADRQRPLDKRLRNRTKATDSLSLPGGRWTAHDLRRTAATVMARLSFGSDVINEVLNHMQTDRMARVYIQDRRVSEQARALDALGAHLAALSSEQ